MKKTLFALMALGCVAYGDDVTTVTLTSTSAASANTKTDAYGLVFDINAGTGYRKEVTAQPTGYNYAYGNSFELQAITLSLDTNQTFSDTVNVVLLNNLNGKADGSADKGELMAFFSHDSLTISGSSLTMDFSDLSVTLQKDTQYRLYFTTADYSESSIGTQITIGTDRTTAPLLGYQDSKNSDRVHLGFLGSGLGPGLSQAYAPAMTMILTPEPATATLSLLALAGLASRRRRH